MHYINSGDSNHNSRVSSLRFRIMVAVPGITPELPAVPGIQNKLNVLVPGYSSYALCLRRLLG
jgi:hypothetical protein